MTLLEAARKFAGEVGDKTYVDVDVDVNVDVLERLHDETGSPYPPLKQFGLTAGELSRKIEQKTEDRIDSYIEAACGYEPGFDVDGSGAEALLCDDRPAYRQACIAGKTTLARLALKLEGGGRLDDTVTQYDGFFGDREVHRGDPLAAGPAGLADVYLYTYRDGSRVISCGELLDELDEAGYGGDGTQWIDESGQEVGRATLAELYSQEQLRELEPERDRDWV